MLIFLLDDQKVGSRVLLRSNDDFRIYLFPDSFIFNVPMSSAFKQIGNAVPPLLAKGVAEAVLKNLNQ